MRSSGYYRRVLEIQQMNAAAPALSIPSPA